MTNEADWHQYQVLTKRAERVRELSPYLKWAPHIWMGVSVESAKYPDRIDHLRKTAAHEIPVAGAFARPASQNEFARD